MPTAIRLPILSAADCAEIDPNLLEVVEYRKSGLSLNHVIGCPLDCAYCVRHMFGNFAMKVPRALMTDETAVDRLVTHRYFQPDLTPIQVFNRATDPFLPVVKPHTFRVLELLDKRRLRNLVLVITRWRVGTADCARLNSFASIRPTILVTHSGIDDPRIEPVDSEIAATSLQTLYEHADRYRVVLYWRPIVPGLNDTDAHLARARDLSGHAHATVYTGLFYRDQIRAYYQELGLPEPYQATARRKILPDQLEQRILTAFADLPGRLYRKTSCGVTAAHHVADYNGHYGIQELCDICPAEQLARCRAAHRRPDQARVDEFAAALGAVGPAEITDRPFSWGKGLLGVRPRWSAARCVSVTAATHSLAERLQLPGRGRRDACLRETGVGVRPGIGTKVTLARRWPAAHARFQVRNSDSHGGGVRAAAVARAAVCTAHMAVWAATGEVGRRRRLPPGPATSG